MQQMKESVFQKKKEQRVKQMRQAKSNERSNYYHKMKQKNINHASD
jgi:hypothetical protein